jgi:hypothetical protein
MGKKSATKGGRGSGEGFGMVNIDYVFIVGIIFFSPVMG